MERAARPWAVWWPAGSNRRPGRTVPPDESSRAPRARAAQRTGAALLVLGALAVAVVLWQPWVSCPGEDSSAGCRPGSGELTGLVIALLVLLTGAVLVARARRS